VNYFTLNIYADRCLNANWKKN